uniref:EF-hand domain-containing protein n=2 Tax=Arion vulgaris TaxID=1028688 RepID=A0A0B7AYK2_9EUPU
MERNKSTDFRILGVYTRMLYSVYKKYDNHDKIKSSDLRQAFHDLHLYPSHSQIQEMVHCAGECGRKCDSDHVTFGEFAVLVDELQHHYEIESPLGLPKSMIRNKSAGFIARRNRKESLANFQVFLGGSCGSSLQPSKWRSETAIPFLKKETITFYNPQVNTWRPELVELEDRAKNAAQLQFFMIDNNTRSVVAVCEIAYLVGCGRQIIVVFSNFSLDVEEVAMEKTSDREREDIMRARNVLMDIVERNGIPVFQDLEAALRCAAVHLKQSVKVQDLTVTHGALPVKHGHVLVGEALLKLRESFNSIAGSSDGHMSKEDVVLGYRCYTGEELNISWLQHLRPQQNTFTFEEFCCLVTEYRRKRPSVMSILTTKLISPVMWLLDKFKRNDQHSESMDDVYDVYLGGSCGAANWREE